MMGPSTNRTPPGCDRVAARAPRSGLRAALVAALAAAALAATATSASAVIIVPSSGQPIGYEPLRGTLGAVRFYSELPLAYHGGPVMTSNTNFALYWTPAGSPAFPSDYEPGVNKYFEDLAHDSLGHENVDSVAEQYVNGALEHANYASKFGGALIDQDPYPASGCSEATICFTKAQLVEEIEKFVLEHGYPHDLKHEYFLLRPPGVEDCFEATACSAGAAVHKVYCAYHSYIPVAGGTIVWSNDPYVTGNAGCEDGEHPNGTSSDGVLQGGLSHEHDESITDPELSAWFAPGTEEIGDKCRVFKEAQEFGTPLGKAKNGSNYNQVVNGAFYWYQQEWSNLGATCLQRLGPTGPAPTVKKVSPKKGHAAGGTTVIVTGTNFAGAPRVAFGGTPAISFRVLSPTSLEAVSPPHAKGAVDVIVTNGGDTSAVNKKDHFKYTK
jgi:hypothetical protein